MELPGVGWGCSGRWWGSHPWRFVKNEWMWHSVLWAGSGTGWKGLEGLFQLKDSGILSRPAALRELKGPIRSLCIPLALEGRAGLSLYYMHAS